MKNEFPLLFPKTSSGKVQKYKLRKMAMEMLGICSDNFITPTQMSN